MGFVFEISYVCQVVQLMQIFWGEGVVEPTNFYTCILDYVFYIIKKNP